MKSIAHDIFTICAVLLIVAWIVVGLSEYVNVGGRTSSIDHNFHAACDSVNGKTVWNGKHWECLK